MGAAVAGLRTASRPAAQQLTFEQEMALRSLAMDDRLAQAGARIAVTLAPIEIPVVDPGPPILPAWQPSYSTPVAQVLERAAHRIGEVGWSRNYLRETGGAVCTLGAIRDVADSAQLAAEAAQMLLDRIHAEMPDSLSVGAWNAAQSGPAPVIRMLGAAARAADRSGPGPVPRMLDKRKE